ncbi:MAG: bacteriohemerythrin [Rhizomicrobium sp.]|nr:bacteriohemerythrin [Rhizomicrobium sp.]
MTSGEVFKTGVAFIDDEHDGLLALIRQLDEALRIAAAPAEISRIFQELVRATETHFWHEEAEFMGTDFPRAAQHARQHLHLKTILTCVQRSLDRSGRDVSFADQLAFLRDWLMDHIVNEDKPLGEYLNAAVSLAASRTG